MRKGLLIVSDPLARGELLLAYDWRRVDCMIAAAAADIPSGLALAAKTAPALIIADLPPETFPTLRQGLRDQGWDGTLLLLAERGEAAEAVDILWKPLRREALEAALRQLREARPQVPREAGALLRDIRSEPTARLIREVLDIIEAHCTESDCTRSQLAARFGFTPGHLGQLFRQETGISIRTYVIRCRMRRATDLLSGTALPVYAVAQACGYRDVAYFSECFKTTVGISPGEYQKRAKRNDP